MGSLLDSFLYSIVENHALILAILAICIAAAVVYIRKINYECGCDGNGSGKGKEKDNKKCYCGYEYYLSIPIVLIAIYLVYYFTIKDKNIKMKATMIQACKKCDEFFEKPENLDTEEIKKYTESCKECTQDCLRDLLIAKRFTEQTGNSKLENYFRGRCKTVKRQEIEVASRI